MDAVVPTGVCGGAGKHMVLFTVLPLPRLLAVIVPALGTFNPTCEAGRASRVRSIFPPFLRCGGTVLRRPAVLVSISSPSPLMELIPSFSNLTSTPMPFRCRTVSRRSTVFLAKRCIDLVRMMSIFPASASSTIFLNSSLLAVPVPEIP